MHRDILLDKEIGWINEQHKLELKHHKTSINLMRRALQQHQESQEAQGADISVLKALVEQLMGQVKGKGNASDLTPEASGAGAGTHPYLQEEEQQGHPGEEGIRKMNEKDLGGNQMRAGT